MCATQWPVWDFIFKFIVGCIVRSMYTQNAGEPSSLIDFFFPQSLPLCYISGTFQFSRAFMVVWPENWDFFIGPGCIFPTTAPITEATNGRKRNQNRGISYPLGSQHLWSKRSPPIPQFAVPAGPSAASVVAIATTLTGLSGLGCKRTGKQRHGAFLNMWGIPFPTFQARTRELLLPWCLLTGFRLPWV